MEEPHVVGIPFQQVFETNTKRAHGVMAAVHPASELSTMEYHKTRDVLHVSARLV